MFEFYGDLTGPSIRPAAYMHKILIDIWRSDQQEKKSPGSENGSFEPISQQEKEKKTTGAGTGTGTGTGAGAGAGIGTSAQPPVSSSFPASPQPLHTYLNSAVTATTTSSVNKDKEDSSRIRRPNPTLTPASASSSLDHPLSPRKIPSSDSSSPPPHSHPLSPAIQTPAESQSQNQIHSYSQRMAAPVASSVPSPLPTKSVNSTTTAPSQTSVSATPPASSSVSTSQANNPVAPVNSPRPSSSFPFPAPILPSASSSSSNTLGSFPSATAAYSAASAYSAAAGVAPPPPLPVPNLNAPTSFTSSTNVPSPSSMARGDSTNKENISSSRADREREKEEQSEQNKLEAELQRFFNGPPPLVVSIDADSVSQDEKGIIKLAEAGKWRQVIVLCERLLNLRDGEPISPANEPDSPTSPRSAALSGSSSLLPHVALRYNSYLLSALMKVQRWDSAQQTLTRIGPFFSPEKQYESYPHFYGERKGNMVPFNLHLLRSELPHFLGQTKQTIDLLFSVRTYVKGQIARALAASASASTPSSSPSGNLVTDGETNTEDESGTDKTNLSRTNSVNNPNSNASSPPSSAPYASLLPLPILYSRLKRIYIKLSNYYLLLPEPDYPTAINLLNLAVNECNGSTDYVLIGYLGRVCMQAGDVIGGKKCFDLAEKGWRSIGEDDQIDLSLHKAILAIQAGEYSAASMIMQAAVIRHESETSHPTSMLNNTAVTLLYSNQISEGISAIEEYVRVAPSQRMDETLLNNLKCLYELRFADSPVKKKMLDLLINMYR